MPLPVHGSVWRENMEDSYTELTDQLNNELTKAYLGGLLDGTGSILARVHKSEDYAFGYNIEPEVTVSKKKPYSIQIMDDWAADNGIYGSAREYKDRYQFRMNSARDIQRLLEELQPYIRDRMEVVELMLEDILPRLQAGDHLESREQFIEIVKKIGELKELGRGTGKDSKYDAAYFRDEWADELES